MQRVATSQPGGMAIKQRVARCQPGGTVVKQRVATGQPGAAIEKAASVGAPCDHVPS